MGVDYSSSMLNIRDDHAYDMSNFLKINNLLQKRSGFEEVLPYKLNGIWECKFKGNTYTIAHIGKYFYLVNGKIDTYHQHLTQYQGIEVSGSIQDKIKDDYSWGVFTNDRLYILCGAYIVIKFKKVGDDVTFTVADVYEDVDTYIPTTTIGITHDKSLIGIQRISLDEPNMMTRQRYNEIYSTESEKYNKLPTQPMEFPYRYILDGFQNTFLNGDVELILNYRVGNKLYQNVKVYSEIRMFGDEDSSVEGELYHAFVRTVGQFGIRDVNSETDINVYEQDEDVFAIITSFESNALLSKIELEPIDEFTPTIKIKFNVISSENKIIENCRFGALYGADGNRNRLFLSGNPDYPNVDYHSSRRNIYATDEDKDLQDSQDLTYFSAFDYCAYGTTNSKITDYQIMGNGELMVLKEGNPNETSIYFRNGQFTNDANGYVVESYSLRSGNIGTGTIQNKHGTLGNLNNDLVFLNERGVFGISSTVSAGMLNSDYKYSYARSNLINIKLAEYLEDNQGVATIVYDSKYFVTIKTKNGEYKTFVGDGRYAYKLPESVDNEYEYEWFVLDNIKADKYYIINNTLYFTNNEGLFKFDYKKKTEKKVDITQYELQSGDILINTYFDDDKEKYVSDINIRDELKNLLSESANLNVAASNISDNSTKIYDVLRVMMDRGLIISVYDQEDIKFEDYFENRDKYNFVIRYSVDGEFYEENITFIYRESYDWWEIRKINEDGSLSYLNHAFAGGEYVTLLVNLNEELITIEKVNDNIKLFNEYKKEVALISIDGYEIYLFGYITLEKVIPSKYVTKAYNMGQSIYNKNLKSITVLNDSNNYSFVNFGIITKEIRKRFDLGIMSGTQGLTETYENIFKSDLTAESFATSFTKNYYLKFNFIQFEFYNNDDSECIINNVFVSYTLGFKQGGVS